MSPSYNSSPLAPTPILLPPGVVGYAFGSFNGNTPTTCMAITQVAASGGTATVTGAVIEGNIPAVGSLITIKGLATSAFNVSAASITAVSIGANTGVGTIQFALGGTVAPTTDAGMAYIPVPEVAENFASGNKSTAFAIQHYSGRNDDGTTIAWSLDFPSAVTGPAVALEISINDNDADYQQLDTANAAGLRYAAAAQFNFVRMHQTAGTGGTIIGRILI